MSRANEVRSANAQLMQTYPAFSRSKFSEWYETTNYDSVDWDGWHMTGYDEPISICNQWAWRGCLNHRNHPNGKIEAQTYKMKCVRSRCRICYGSWIARETSKSYKRIKKFEMWYAGRDRLKHVIVSVPRWEQGKPLEELRKEMRKLCKRAGLRGGLDVVHPFRCKEGKWFFSPHFHVLAYGWVKGTENIFKEKGWIIKNMGVRKSTKGTISYILSHAGIKKRRHTLTWWGELSYSKLKLEKTDDDENKHRCTLCDAVYKPLIYFKDGFRCKPPPVEVIITDDPYGWQYLEDFNRESNNS